MMWWKKIASLKDQLNEVHAEQQKDQGKTARLTGFLKRLQAFGVTPAGRIPHQEFAEALVDSVHTLLEAGQAMLLRADPQTQDLLPDAGRGFAPEILSRLRVHPGEGVLGRAAQGLQILVGHKPSAGAGGEEFLVAPYMILPLASQGRCAGLLVIAAPADGAFSPETQEMAALLAAQAALILEGHGFYDALNRLRVQSVNALLQAIDAKDAATHEHSDRTRSLVYAVCREIPLPDSLILQIELGACLHDIGKIGIEDAILKKAGPLTPEEYTVMKTHPAIGMKILEPIQFLKAVGAIVLYHQEWYNGAGYPEGLAGEEIPLGARIVQIIDAWDAMTSDRPYRRAMAKAAAVTELRRQAGTQFDPKLVETFLRVMDRLDREGTPTTEERPAATLESR